MPPGPSGGREREILTAIVETFIASGEPVGSRTIARGSREGLSAATIRNVMADLTDAGFLEQPHTSAGRVPTRGGLSLLCRATERGSAPFAREQEHYSGHADWSDGRAGVHGADFACAVAGVAQRGSGGGDERSAECAGACLFFAAGRSESAGGGGDEVGSGAGPGAAAGYSAGRSGCGGALSE